MGFLGAIFIISQGVNVASKSVVLVQKAASKGNSEWIQVMNNMLSDKQAAAVHPKKALTNKLALEADASQARVQCNTHEISKEYTFIDNEIIFGSLKPISLVQNLTRLF